MESSSLETDKNRLGAAICLGRVQPFQEVGEQTLLPSEGVYKEVIRLLREKGERVQSI